MYINYPLLFDKGLKFEDLNTLIQINQQEVGLLEDKDFSEYEKLDLITYVKSAGKPHERVRLTTKGKTFLKNCSEKGFSDDLADLQEEMISLYQREGKDTGNPLEIRNRLLWFIAETGFGSNSILEVIQDYLSEGNKFIVRLDNLLWKPPSMAFSVHYNLKDSKLFELITTKYNIPMNFFINNKHNKQESWVFDMCKLKIPKKLTPEFYWTGSYEGDINKQKEFKKLFKQFL